MRQTEMQDVYDDQTHSVRNATMFYVCACRVLPEDGVGALLQDQNSFLGFWHTSFSGWWGLQLAAGHLIAFNLSV